MNLADIHNQPGAPVCTFDVRQAPHGGYATRITGGKFDPSAIAEIGSRWSFLERPELLAGQVSLYIRQMTAETDNGLCCVSCLSPDPNQSAPAVWATHVLVNDGRRALRSSTILTQLFASRGAKLPPPSLTGQALETLVQLLGIEGVIALLSSLYQIRDKPVVVVGPMAARGSLRCGERLWAFRAALWLVDFKRWPVNWAILGSTSYLGEEDELQLLWYPERAEAQYRPRVIALDPAGAERTEPASSWLRLLETWFRSGDFDRVVRAGRRMVRWKVDPSDDERARNLEECSVKTGRTPVALLKAAAAAERLCLNRNRVARLELLAARRALGRVHGDLDLACRILEKLQRDHEFRCDVRLAANVPVVKLLDRAFAAGGKQPERVLLLLTQSLKHGSALRQYFKEHADALEDWLASDGRKLQPMSVRALAHRLSVQARISPLPVFKWLTGNGSRESESGREAELLLEFWDYRECRRFAVEHGLCRALLGRQDLATDVRAEISTRYLVELALSGSQQQLSAQIGSDLEWMEDSPRLAERWLTSLLGHVAVPGLAASLMEAVCAARPEPTVADRLLRSVWERSGLPEVQAAAWAERFLVDLACPGETPHTREFWFEKAVHCHLAGGDHIAVERVLARDELADDDELTRVLLALMDYLDDSHVATLWSALAKSRPLRFNVALFGERLRQRGFGHDPGVLDVACRILAGGRSSLVAGDLDSFHTLERIVHNCPLRSSRRHELASLFECAGDRLMECFEPEHRPRSLVRSAARWRRRSAPSVSERCRTMRARWMARMESALRRSSGMPENVFVEDPRDRTLRWKLGRLVKSFCGWRHDS